jgi:zinc protease
LTAAAPAVVVRAAEALPEGVARVASVEGITEYRLENGLRVLFFPEPSKSTVTVNVTYLVGSRHESYGETGMAHLLEHLVFKGTPTRADIYQELTAHGARPNGSTWWDRTNYFETLPATDENLEWALAMEADRMVNSLIAKKDLDSEMTVVRNELELGENDPTEILEERTASTAFLWHNYGKSTIGARSDLENVPIERLQAFYRNYYQPDNAVLVVAGRIDEAKTLALVRKHFAPIPRPARTLFDTYTLDPTQDGERTVTLRRVGDVQAVCAMYHIPAGSHPDAAAIDVLAEVLGATPSGRLHAALVETKKASAVSGYQYQLREPGMLVVNAEVRREASLDEAREALVSATEGVVSRPPTAEEVERARTALLKPIDLALKSPERLGITLSEWIAMGDWRLYFIHRDRLRAVTPADVARVAAAYLKPSNRTLGVFVPTDAPDRAEIPPAPAIAALIDGYAGDAAVASGEAFDPSPASIDARTQRLTLPAGAKVALLSKKTRGGAVAASLVFHFGDEASLRGKATLGELAAAMLTRGTTKHSRQEIQDVFDRMRARVRVGGGATEVSVAIETVRESLLPVVDLVAEILREPSFPESEFELLRQERLAEIEERRSDPGALGWVEYIRHVRPFPKEDVRYTMTLDEAIDAVGDARLADVRRFHGDFYGGSSAEIAVVGDFDAAEVARALTERFGSWRSPRPFRRVPDLYVDAEPIDRVIETPDKANAFFYAGVNLAMRDDDPDYPALALGNFLFGGGFLNSRLADRLRQQDGMSYTVRSQLTASSFERRSNFSTFAIYAPENAERVEAAYREELARALAGGFTDNEIAAAKSGYLQRRSMSRGEDGALAGILAAALFTDRTLAWEADHEAKVDALTPAQVVEGMRRQIDPAKVAVVKAGDFEGAARATGSGAATGSASRAPDPR